MKPTTSVSLVIMFSIFGIILLSSFVVLNAFQEEWMKVFVLSLMVIISVFFTVKNYKNLKYLRDRQMYWGD